MGLVVKVAHGDITKVETTLTVVPNVPVGHIVALVQLLAPRVRTVPIRLTILVPVISVPRRRPVTVGLVLRDFTLLITRHVRIVETVRTQGLGVITSLVVPHNVPLAKWANTKRGTRNVRSVPSVRY